MTRAFLRRTPISLVLGFSALLLSPTESLAGGLIRFIQAVPSAGEVSVQITQAGSEHNAGDVAFGKVTPWRSIRPSRFAWRLVAGGRTLAHGTATVGDGAYDLVFLAEPTNRVSLGIYRAQGAKPGTALVRTIHAAPELGSPQLRMDDKATVSSLAFTQATAYREVAPGVHTLSASPASRSTPLLSGRLTLRADQAYSDIIIGSAGQKVRWITLVDRPAPPTRATVPGSSAAPTLTTGASVEVKPGDSLWQIARDDLGPAASDETIHRAYLAIWHLNEKRIGTGDPNLIFPGQRVTLPATHRPRLAHEGG